MPDNPEAGHDALAEFDARQTKQGLLLRFAAGRVRHFWRRQTVTFLGSAALGWFVDPVIGLATASLAIGGEAFDCLVLARFPEMSKRGTPVATLERLCAATGAVQALTIAACVVIAAHSIGGSEGLYFASAFLAGTAVNAGLTLAYSPLATIVRFVIYGLTFAGVMAMTIMSDPAAFRAHVFTLLGAGMMAFMVFAYVDFIVRTNRRHRASAARIVASGQALAAANAELRAKQEEAEQLALVARHANDSVVMSDPLGRICWVNHAFTRVTGYSLDEAMGRTLGELLDGPETSTATGAEIAAAIKAGQTYRGEILNYSKDGRKFWVETNMVPVLDAKGAVRIVLSVERDISQAMAHQAELAEAKRAAEEGARLKAHFLATMSHEIRTPMNAILGMADLICDEDLTAEARLYAVTIRDSADALLAIINDILDLSKLDAGKLTLAPVDFSPAGCLRSTFELFTPLAREKGLEFSCEPAPDMPGLVHGDDGRFRQIIVNLVGNALKFTSRGSVRVSASARRAGDVWQIEVRVADTGIGIEPAKLQQVFEDFAQADGATTRRFGGTGLGLAISRRLARQMGGDIAVQSKPGGGTIFVVAIPFALPLGSRADPEDAGDRAGGDIPPGLSVLIAEDNGTNRLLIGKYLKGLPISVEFAEDGRKAVDAWTAGGHDVVFMDMSMPVMDGLAASRAIRASPGGNRPRILALTANVQASDRRDCLAAGMDGFLTKPIRKTDLIAELRQPAEGDAFALKTRSM